MHVDLREHRRAQHALVKQLFERAHRLVVAHVLVYRQDLAGGPCLVAQGAGFVQRQGEGLLCQHATHVRGAQCGANQRGLQVRRVRDVHDLDLRIGDQGQGVLMYTGDAVAFGDRGRFAAGTRRDRRHREAGLLVGRQVALGHDHAGADAADAKAPFPNGRVGHQGWVRHVLLLPARYALSTAWHPAVRCLMLLSSDNHIKTIRGKGGWRL
ncbi:hypothetical protein D3C85_1282440 [compost metagenome]